MKSSLLFVLAVVGCTGTETGNPSFTSQLAVGAHSSHPERIAVRRSAGGAVVRDVWAQMLRFDFTRGEGCDDVAASTMEEMPQNHAEASAVLQFDLPEDDYCEVEIELAPIVAAVGGAPAETEGNVIYLRGELADGRPLTIASKAAFTAALAAEGGTFTMSSEMPALVLGLDVATWLDRVDLDGVTGDAVTLSDEENTALLREFEQKIAAGLELYRDPNGDGSLMGEAAVRVARSR